MPMEREASVREYEEFSLSSPARLCCGTIHSLLIALPVGVGIWLELIVGSKVGGLLATAPPPPWLGEASEGLRVSTGKVVGAEGETRGCVIGTDSLLI